jgi:hypothetical protein
MALATVTEKKRRGRPPGKQNSGGRSTTSAAQEPPEFDEGGEAYQVPAGVRGMPPGENFWEQMANFEPREWDSELIAYLWRIAPIHDRRFAGKPTSIAKYSRPFDLETIKNEHGSGGYRIDLSRIPGNGGKQTRIGQEYFQIMDVDKPPRMPAGDWLNWPENELWKWAGPALRTKEAEAQQAAATATSGGQPQDGTRMFNTILEGVRTLRGEQNGNNDLAIALLEMAQADRAKMAELNDPAKQLLTIKSLMEALIPKQDNSAVQMLMQMMQADLKFQREQVASLRTELSNRPDPITSLIEVLPRLTPILEVFGFKPGARAPVATGTDWGAIVSNVVDKLSDHVPAILETVKIAKANGNGTAADTKAVQPWKPGVVTDAPKAAAAAAAPDPDETPEVKEARAKMAEAEKNFGGLIRSCLPHMLDCYRNLTGYDFRDWMIDRKGRDQWLALKEKVGSVTLVQLAMNVPALREQLSPPEKFHAFLEEVFTEVGKEAADRLSPLPDDEGEPDEATLEAELRLADQIQKARTPEIISPLREGARA